MNTDNALSYDQSRAGDGAWDATISANRPADGAWISSRNSGTFDLTLRLYVPEPALLDTPDDALTPPAIVRLQCEGANP